MRRAPIVVAATAAGLAGVLGFHTQQPSLLSGLSVVARPLPPRVAGRPRPPLRPGSGASTSTTAPGSTSTPSTTRPLDHDNHPDRDPDRRRGRRAVPLRRARAQGDGDRREDHQRPACHRHRLRRPLVSRSIRMRSPNCSARPCRRNLPTSMASRAPPTPARPMCSRFRPRSTSSGSNSEPTRRAGSCAERPARSNRAEVSGEPRVGAGARPRAPRHGHGCLFRRAGRRRRAEGGHGGTLEGLCRDSTGQTRSSAPGSPTAR